MFYQFREDHPYRPVNWRWERARILRDYGKQAPGQDLDDKWTRSAANFRTAKDSCKDELTLYTLFDKHRDLAMAYELWDENSTNTTGRSNPMRYEIEARILAKEPLEQIAQKSRVPIAALRWYEKLFFNVIDRLDNDMYIMHQVIGDAIQRGMTDRDYAILWKLYAYRRGSAMLDFLISTFADWSKPSPAQLDAALMDDFRLNTRRKAMLASRSMGVNQHTADRIVELHTKIIEIEKVASGGNPDSMGANIQIVMGNIATAVGTKSVIDTEDMVKLYAHTADFRASETFLLDGKQLNDNILDCKFPEPIKNGKETNQAGGTTTP